MSKSQVDFFKKKNEWSEIKDRLLEGYLPQYFQKLLTTHRQIFYVDCFAGKGKFDDGKDGSPLIALKIANDCLERSRIDKKQGAIQTCFIELNHATDLQKNLSQVRFEHVEKRVINGKFEDNIRNLLINKKGKNVFLYIDPYGIRALDLQLFEEFQGYGFKTFEMLINFNSFGFLRNACSVMNVDVSRDEALLDLSDLVEYDPTIVTPSSQSEKLLNSVAGGNYWKDIVNDFQKNKIDGYEAEKTFSNEYKKQLKRKYKYVLDMPIRLQPEQRPKYRMIHVCDHEDGCFLMASNMQKRKDELFINIQQGGQLSLFDCSTSVASTIEGEVITDKQIENMVQARIKSLVYDTHLKVFLADFCNEYGIVCPFRMIYKSLEKIEESGEIQIIRDPALTSTGKKRSFWEENKQQKVIIRRRRL